ncbi:zinc-binding dehydrogenase [Streptomyces sp. NPDC002588]|uniref:zinc-binding dehydrogenase n=1 Tax=Streptomyces sp. NPDC002588 TaxID=3154419 RepID=UPI0033211620
MRALHVPAAGEQPVLGELPTPAVPDGHVLIKVEAVGLNALANILADFVTAAALPLAGAAALATVEHVDPRPGQVVLVNGATGGVGSYAVQLPAARGANVVATGTSADAERLTELGATTVVDFTAGSVADQVRELHPDGADGLVNLVGNTIDDVPLAAVRKNGKVGSTTVNPDADALAAAGLTGTTVFAAPGAETIAPLAEQAANGTLSVEVGTVLPLDRAAEGLAIIAAGKAGGKIVITINDQVY